MTKIAWKVGGPGRLLIATLVGGYIIVRVTEAGGKKVFKAAGGKKAFKAWVAALKTWNTPCAMKGQLFRVATDGEDSSGLKLSAGDEYRVLECIAEGILIEVLNDPNNPYFVSREFLTAISDFPAEGTGKVQAGD
ncbi:hypothetical protein [Catellatospora sp. TT07R-123]|uniref:hypothetical protein n=1 Tax=Catellatospora sp. TT07R-123 TaxID=2733863 RepID=UPI001BB43100|nr:hypothetical protein [Catellatospora sp. TT07R-123]